MLTFLMRRSIYLIELSLYNKINQNNFVNYRFNINLSKMRVAPEFFLFSYSLKTERKNWLINHKHLMVPWFSLSDL